MIVKTLKKYFLLFCLFAKYTLIQHTASRGTFVMAVLGKMLRSLLLVVFFQAIFFRIPDLAGWSFPEILLLVAVYLTVEYIAVITFHRNLAYYFPKALKDGSFDFYLIKPIHPLFHAAFRYIDAYDITSLPPLIVIWIYALTQYAWSFNSLDVLLFFIFLAGALVFYFSLLLLVASTAFWTINATGIGRLMENLLRVARYPTTMFDRLSRVLFLYILPVSLAATLPVEILLHRASLWYSVFASVFIILLFTLSLAFWKFALKHYSSASS